MAEIEIDITSRFTAQLQAMEARLQQVQEQLAAIATANGQSADGSHEHCWHDAQPDNFAYRLEYPVVCCHCGEQQTFVKDNPTMHGPYQPVSRNPPL